MARFPSAKRNRRKNSPNRRHLEIEGTKSEAKISLATELAYRCELVLGEYYVKTITDCFAGSGVHLRDADRARTAVDSSTDVNSARQRHHQWPDRRLAGQSTSRLGMRSQWHIHGHHGR